MLPASVLRARWEHSSTHYNVITEAKTVSTSEFGLAKIFFNDFHSHIKNKAQYMNRSYTRQQFMTIPAKAILNYGTEDHKKCVYLF